MISKLETEFLSNQLVIADIKTSSLVKATLKPIVAGIMAMTNLTEGGSQTGTFENLYCSPTFITGIGQELVYLSAVNIILSLTAFLGNALILVALQKESSLHPPSKILYRCLATTDLCVGIVIHPLAAAYLMSLVHEHWSLCRYTYDALFTTAYALFSVSLLTLTAISVDRLLALLLRLKYRQVVTLRRTYIVVVIFWVVSGVAALCRILAPSLAYWYSYIGVPSCLVISFASYTKMLRALGHHRSQEKDRVQQLPSQPTALNMARYRKAVYGALWVQLALVVCYLPHRIVSAFLAYSGLDLSFIYFLAEAITAIFVYFNSTLNPFLYCWKISEVRQVVKQTIRQALCC